MNLNKATIVGRLTRDPEVKALPSGQSVASFGIATNRVWTNQDGNKQEATEYHNVVTFGKLADICSRYLNKGRLVLVEGRLQTRSWQDQNGGAKRYRTEIVVNNMQMGPRPGFNTATNNQAPDAQSTPPQNTSPQSPQSVPQEEIPVIDAEEPLEQEQSKGEESKEEQPKEEQPKEEIDIKNIPF